MRKKQHAPNLEKLAVVLDIQIGALRPVDALAYGLPWLQYDNVHLALDPEFAYLAENNLPGERILRIHQFLDTMIVDKPDLDWNYDHIALTISADGSDVSGVPKALTCISQGDTINFIISA